jgi:hypothetical protein
MPETDPSRLIAFRNHQPGDQETTDDEEKAHPQITIEQPVEYW